MPPPSSSSGDRLDRGADGPVAVPADGTRPHSERGAAATMVLDREGEARTPPRVRGRTRAERPPLAAVDRGLALVAHVTSVLAQVLLAGLPLPDAPVGTAIRGVVHTALWLTGPGAAVAVHLRLRASTKVAVTPLLGMGLLIGLSLLGVWTGIWMPRLDAVVVAVLTLLAVGVPLVRHPAPQRAPAERGSRGTTALLAVGLLVSLGLWVAALPGIRTAEPSIFGLLASGPVLLPIALAGVLLIGLLALRLHRPVLAGAAVGGLVLVLRGTTSFGTEAAGPSWAYKHIGVVEQLLAQQQVTPGTDIYMNWPGMFSAAAYLSDLSGVSTLALALWITPVVHVVIALQAFALARVFGATVTGSVAASMLIVVVNWVGQDYFAPQALALCLAGGVLVTLAQSRASRTCAVLSVVLFAAIVPTHQLTPFWLLGLGIVLAVLRRVPWWVLLAMVAVLAAFVIPRLDVVETYGLFSGFDPVGNATNNVPGVQARGSDMGSLVARATVVVMWLSTLAVLVVRLHRAGWRRPWRHAHVVVPAVMAFSPIALLGGQNYGGEAINRVILYSCLGCAAVLGPALAGVLQRRLLPAAAAAVWAVVLTALAAQASFTQWPMNVIRDEDVAATRWLAQEAPDATVIPVVFNWPGRVWTAYDRYFVLEPAKDASLEGILSMQAADAGEPVAPNGIEVDLAELEQIVQQRPEDPAYVVFSASMRARDEYYATYRPGVYQDLLDAVRTSPDWELVRSGDDLWAFQYVATGFPVR